MSLPYLYPLLCCSAVLVGQSPLTRGVVQILCFLWIAHFCLSLAEGEYQSLTLLYLLGLLHGTISLLDYLFLPGATADLPTSKSTSSCLGNTNLHIVGKVPWIPVAEHFKPCSMIYTI